MNSRWLPGRAGSGALLATATTLLVWGTVFNGFRFGPVRFVLRALPHSDKLGHFALYGSMTLGAALLVRTRQQAIGAALAIIIVGVLDEFRQLFQGGRNFDIADVLANLGGISLGLLAALVVMRVAGHPTTAKSMNPNLGSTGS